MNVLFIADIIGKPGRFVTNELLPGLKKELEIDLCIANGENVSGGKGLSEKSIGRLNHYGIDVITSGNHIWNNKDYQKYLDKPVSVLRPLNFPSGVQGRGKLIRKMSDGNKVMIMNFQGRTFMQAIDCPFQIFNKEIKEVEPDVKIIIIDFHAEATSEKNAFAWFVDGKVSAVIGTHTHIPTADEKILPKGTGYITDAGMTGSLDSVIGMKKNKAIAKFLYQIPVRFEPADTQLCFNGVFLKIDDKTGNTLEIRRVSKILEEKTRE